MARTEPDATPLDDAARAGWLYYVGGLTQDQIARELGVSRQRAQRLVSRAMAEGLIHVRLEHPIADCMRMEAELTRRFGLKIARVAPSLAGVRDQTAAIAPVAAKVMERFLAMSEPLIISLGTGRAMRAMVEEVTSMDCPHHKLVSLIGNIAPDGSASNYDVIMRIAEKVRAPHYPMPLPVFLDDARARGLFYGLRQMQIVAGLAREADVNFVGVGQMNDTAPMYVDGFVTLEALREQQALGAVGEIASWPFDSDGRYIASEHCDRIGGLRVQGKPGGHTIGIAAGPDKVPALRAALKGKLLNGLVTSEETAAALLS